MTITQKQQVLAHLEKYGSITSWEAIKKYNITRLAAIIFDLRDEGNKVFSSIEKKDGKKWAKYVLMKLKAK